MLRPGHLPGTRDLIRRALIAAGTLLVLATVLYVAYESAQARIPQHRAALERLVRAQTGLDLRFNSLALQWGWAGPEVAFRRIELSEAADPGFVLRSAQLIVGFDAWRSIQTGHPELGSIRLIAPDIDLAAPAAVGTADVLRADRSARARSPATARALKVLRRWSGGRIELDGGTVRVAGADGESVSLQIRSASFARFGRKWSGETDILLPARLGRTLRLSMELNGDTFDAPNVAGVVRFDGRGLIVTAWRTIMGDSLPRALLLPIAGSGTLRGLIHLRAGRIADGSGSLVARDLAFDAAELGEVRTNWQIRRQRNEWHVGLTQLALDAALSPGSGTARQVSRASLTFDPVAHRAQGTLDTFSLTQAARLLRLTDGQGDTLHGRLTDIVFDWDAQRPRLRQLNLAARWRAPSEGDVAAGAEAPHPFDIDARLSWHETPAGWALSADRLVMSHGDSVFELSGSLAPWRPRGPRPYEVKARIAHADAAVLHELIGAAGDAWLSPRVDFARGNEIDQAQFRASGDASLPHAIEWSANVLGARLSGLEVETISVAGKLAPTPGPVPATAPASATSTVPQPGAGLTALTVRARGDLVSLHTWLQAHAMLASAAQPVASLPALTGRAVLDFDLHGASDRGSRAQLMLEDARLTLGSQFPAVESLSGRMQIENGRLRRSILSGTWLGGALELRLAQRESALVAQLDGEIDAAQAAEALGLDAELLRGRTSWHGEWQWEPARDAMPAVWHGSAQSGLSGIASVLPPPFDKQARESLPLRIDVEGDDQRGTLRVAASGRLQAVLALVPDARDTWRVERAGLVVGEGGAAVPERAILAVSGALPAADLGTMLMGWRDLIGASETPPLEASLHIAALSAAGRRFEEVQLDASQTKDGLQIAFDSPSLSGTLHLPPDGDARTATVLHLSHLALADPTSDFALGRLRRLLGSGARIVVDRLDAGERELGHLSALVANEDDALAIDSLELSGALFDAHGRVRCADGGLCRGELSLETSDVAATLADFGFRDDVSAGRGLLDASLVWDRHEFRASMEGHVSLALTDGTVRSVSSAREPFALFVMPVLLGSASAEAMSFRKLEGDFELRDGSAYTSNLHLDGDAEVFVRGRTGILARDYDQSARVLRGTERLPAAIRRIGAAPAVASLWLGLRDFLAADSPRKVLHIGGSWSAPVVTPQSSTTTQPNTTPQPNTAAPSSTATQAQSPSTPQATEGQP